MEFKNKSISIKKKNFKEEQILKLNSIKAKKLLNGNHYYLIIKQLNLQLIGIENT